MNRTGRLGLASLWQRLLLLLGAVSLTACASLLDASDQFQKPERVAEVESHIAGEALAQKKQAMRRAHRDMIGFHATIQGLRRHSDRQGVEVLEAFVRPYLSTHVDPLLTQNRENWHPELLPLDANLLFAKAAILIQLQDRWGVAGAIHEIAVRFGGLAFALSSTLFALVGFALLEGLKIKLYGRLLRSLDDALFLPAAPDDAPLSSPAMTSCA